MRENEIPEGWKSHEIIEFRKLYYSCRNCGFGLTGNKESALGLWRGSTA